MEILFYFLFEQRFEEELIVTIDETILEDPNALVCPDLYELGLVSASQVVDLTLDMIP